MKTIFYVVTIILTLSACSWFGPTSDDHGKRTFGTKLDDGRTESLAERNIRILDPQLEDAHFDITSFNGMVLITGQVASEELVEMVTKLVMDMRNVSKVHNELEIAGPTSFLTRTSDNWLETKIKSSMIASPDTDANRIEIVTENGTVYLMGLVTREEAEMAVQLTRQVYGIQKIVKVFEYIN